MKTSLIGIGEYLCSANVLKAHALAYRSYRNTFYDQFKGQIGITLSSRFFYSDTNDTNLVDRAMQFYVCTKNEFIISNGNRLEQINWNLFFSLGGLLIQFSVEVEIIRPL